MTSSRRIGWLLTCLLAMAGGACSNEGREAQAVTSETRQGTHTAPSSLDVSQRRRALVRIAHAMTGSSTVDVYAQDQKAFPLVGYRAVTAYAEIPVEVRRFTVRVVDQEESAPLAEGEATLTSGAHYTLVIFPSRDGAPAKVEAFADKLSVPADQVARVRFINAAGDIGTPEIFARNYQKVWFERLEFGTATDYYDAEDATVTVDFRAPDTRRVLLSAPSVRLAPDSFTTIIAAGRAIGVPPLEPIVIKDTFAGT
jgi:hypothetical protein